MRRIRNVCYNELLSQTEDEIRFLFDCQDCQWRYIALRDNFIAEVTSLGPQFYKLNNNIQKFVNKMSSEDQIIVRKFSLFVTIIKKETQH